MSLTGTVNDATATNSPCGFSQTYCGSSSNNNSTQLCIKRDFSYDSLLSLESEDSEWISDSKSNHGLSSENPSTPLSTNGIQCVRSEDNVSVKHLLEIEDMQEFSTDGPLFWPYEGKFSLSFEEYGSPFCISPRGGLEFGSKSMTPRIKENSMSAKSSAETEISIETLVGLKEFDGREGLDSEFNGDVFMLEESLNNSCTGL